ncbi:MAG: hypothetical protein H0T78_04775 [Longispora sp.]|nr:hypothetical protein [Longispora sp. (in: high G+C Gram-positive bacteria)]
MTQVTGIDSSLLNLRAKPEPWRRGLADLPDEQLSLLGDSIPALANIANTELIHRVIHPVAGIGEPGATVENGLAAISPLNRPHGIAVEADGNILIADTRSHRIRRVSASGNITTIAGNGVAGESGNGLLATNAQLNWPSGVATGLDGSVLVADLMNHQIRSFVPSPMATAHTSPMNNPCCTLF